MKLIIFLVFTLVTISNSYCQPKHTIEVMVTNIVDIQGTIYLGLYDNSDSFKNKTMAIDSVIITPNSDKIKIKLENVESGEYAIAIYQDINNNGKLDTGKLKIPQEPVGISNHSNLKRIGIPTYDKAKIKINGDTTVSIPLISKK